MNINKTHYKLLSEPQKVYLDMSTLKIREKLNMAFINPTAEDDMTGIFGKYYKLDKMYKVKYIFERNKQLQPQTFDRYYYLLDVNEDEKGSYIEYAMVYDKLFDPLVRFVYVFAVVAVLAYLYYLYSQKVMQAFSAITLGVIVVASVALVFKKSKESADICGKAEKLLKKLIEQL